jgi:hypothetical protein
MLTFALVPQTRLVKGFQSTVNATEKTSPQSPTPINHPPSADSFTPSAVKSRVGTGTGMGKLVSWEEGGKLPTLVQLQVKLLGIVQNFSSSIDSIVQKHPPLERKILGKPHQRTLEKWVRNEEENRNSRLTISDQELAESIAIFKKVLTDSAIKKALKENALNLLEELETTIEQIKELST